MEEIYITIANGKVITRDTGLSENHIDCLEAINAKVFDGNEALIIAEKDGHHLRIIFWQDPFTNAKLDEDELEAVMDQLPNSMNVYEYITNRIDSEW